MTAKFQNLLSIYIDAGSVLLHMDKYIGLWEGIESPEVNSCLWSLVFSQ